MIKKQAWLAVFAAWLACGFISTSYADDKEMVDVLVPTLSTDEKIDEAETQEQEPTEAPKPVEKAEAKPQAAAKPAKKAPPKPEPITTEDLDIHVDELKLMVKPLAIKDLELEATAWFKALQKQSKAVTELELATTRLNKKQLALTEQLESLAVLTKPKEAAETTSEAAKQESTEEEIKPEDRLAAAQALLSELDEQAPTDLDSAEDLDKALGVVNEALDKEKEALTEETTQLREKRTALIDRFNVVLNAINTKAGAKEDGTDNDLVVPYRRYIKTVSGLNVDLKDTKSTVKTVEKWVKSKEGGQRWMKNIGLFFGILFGFWILSFILSGLVKRALRLAGNTSTLLSNFLTGVVKKGTMLIGLVMSLAALEVNIAPLLAALGAAGFILAFALQGTISNFASGILMMIYRPFDIGDSIEAGGVSGNVESMNLVSTHITTPDNQRMVVPNNSIWGGSITNASNTNRRRVDMSFKVSGSDGVEKVTQLLEDLVNKHPKVLDTPAPSVSLSAFEGGSMTFSVLPWALTSDYSAVKGDITRAVKAYFDEGELTMPE